MLTEEQLPISIDTAVEIIGRIRMKTIMKEDEYPDFKERLNGLIHEEEVALGVTGSDEERLELFRKVISVYSPMLKNHEI